MDGAGSEEEEGDEGLGCGGREAGTGLTFPPAVRPYCPSVHPSFMGWFMECLLGASSLSLTTAVLGKRGRAGHGEGVGALETAVGSALPRDDVGGGCRGRGCRGAGRSISGTCPPLDAL